MNTNNVIKQIQKIQDQGIIIYSKFKTKEFDQNDVYRESYGLVVDFNNLTSKNIINDENLVNNTACVLHELRRIAVGE
ncbi:hypothetical protein KQL69_005375 [Escherichia coli]|nr:hypothetical protein [Escherichia coli]EHP9631618.1 hypothetical protein [Escherichia coli]EHP9636486.1 hypothetical protein [Escherichia coli]EHP9641684.1 hypothetical protein [Escherichia coli]EHP9647073.1 hypothetical protein [Escherichia coli]